MLFDVSQWHGSVKITKKIRQKFARLHIFTLRIMADVASRNACCHCLVASFTSFENVFSVFSHFWDCQKEKWETFDSVRFFGGKARRRDTCQKYGDVWDVYSLKCEKMWNPPTDAVNSKNLWWWRKTVWRCKHFPRKDFRTSRTFKLELCKNFKVVRKTVTFWI